MISLICPDLIAGFDRSERGGKDEDFYMLERVYHGARPRIDEYACMYYADPNVDFLKDPVCATVVEYGGQ